MLFPLLSKLPIKKLKSPVTYPERTINILVLFATSLFFYF